MLVRLKLAESDPLAAVTTNAPMVELAVKVGAVTVPLAPVATVAVALLPGKVPLAVAPGAVKVTLRPLMGLFEASVILTVSGAVKGWSSDALCGVPAGVMMAGAPGRLVSRNTWLRL